MERETAVDGTLVDAWLAGSSDSPERVQVGVIWYPAVYVNGVQIGPEQYPMDPLPEVSLAMTLSKVSLRAARERAFEDELGRVRTAAIDEGLVETFARINLEFLPLLMRVVAARRGFPLP